MRIKPKILILLALSLILISCSSAKDFSNNADLETVVSKEQIDFRFEWQNKELEDGDTYSFVITEHSDDPTVYEVSQYLTVADGKMGFSVKVKENTWSISDIYDNTNREDFAPRETSPRYELYLNASWRLEPLLDDQIIYLDEYIIDNFDKSTADITPLTLFNLIDKNTGTTFSYNLICVYDDNALKECW